LPVQEARSKMSTFAEEHNEVLLQRQLEREQQKHAREHCAAVQAQFEEGLRLYHQSPVSQPLGADRFRSAAEAGHAVATVWLSECYLHGGGVEQSGTEAHRLAAVALDERGLRALGASGDASAQCALGSMYHLGNGVDKDVRAAMSWYRQAADGGNAVAQWLLGEAYASGSPFIDKHEPEALLLFSKAAEQEDAVGLARLGEMRLGGKGCVTDRPRAVALFQRAAAQGHAASMAHLGRAYRDGSGVEAGLDEAIDWFGRAADAGDADGQCAMGEAYRDGAGVRRDRCAAVVMFRRAAVQGHADAQWWLGEAYSEGEGGVERDARQAARWLRKAAEQGVGVAQLALGLMCRDGDGVQQDEREAAMWLRRAGASAADAEMEMPDGGPAAGQMAPSARFR
jgi:TPR repeat protein